MGAPRKKKIIATEESVVAPLVSATKLRLTGAQVMHIISAVVVLVSIGTALYFRSEYQQAVAGKDASSEVREITDEVGAFLELPADEVPTLATVTDKGKLANEAFFSAAENGDKILIYQKSRKAIIYRPSTGKLVNVAILDAAPTQEESVPAPAEEVAPVSETAPTAEETVSAAPAVPVLSDEELLLSSATIALYNGSKTVGVTNQAETDIVGTFQNPNISVKEKASRKDYVGTLVVDISGNNAQLAAKLAEVLGGTVVTALPEGETNPGTDILIIVGNKAAL
jgi:hypothetical protein